MTSVGHVSGTFLLFENTAVVSLVDSQDPEWVEVAGPLVVMPGWKLELAGQGPSHLYVGCSPTIVPIC
jgi:hypothetical protein